VYRCIGGVAPLVSAPAEGKDAVIAQLKLFISYRTVL
jgi:hypothetical protein